MQMLADEHLPERVCLASIEDTIHQTFQFEQGLLWDSPYNIEQINFAQDSHTDRDKNLRANAPVRPVYGGQVLPEMQVEGEPTVCWRGMPVMYTACNYDSDEIAAALKHKFCMGMLVNRLLRTLTELGFRVRLGDLSGRGRRSMSKDM